MKNAVFFLFFSVCVLEVSAQKKWVNMLSCDTWGNPDWVPYQELQDKPSGRAAYEHYDNELAVSYVSPLEPQPIRYTNNILIIRWRIKNYTRPHRLIIMDAHDEVLYDLPMDKQCAALLFPDSIMAEAECRALFFTMKPEDNRVNYRGNQYAKYVILPYGTVQRKEQLNELKACPDVKCKVELLKQEGQLLEAMTLLELEKMRNSADYWVTSAFWQLASEARMKWAKASEIESVER